MCYCPTPTLHLNLALTGDGAFIFSLKKTHSVWFISILNYGDTENVLINHLLLVIPMSYPCHYTNLCPHKPHKHAHTHTHTHTTVLCASHRMMESLWIIMMLRTALLCRKHTSKHKNYSVYSVCVWVRFCLDCGCQIYRSMFATIHLNPHMDNRLTDFVTDLLRGFKASHLSDVVSIWVVKTGLDQPERSSLFCLFMCVYVHIRKLYTGQVPQIRLLDLRVHERVCNGMPDRMCSSSLFHPGEAQFPFLSLLFSFCH